MQKNCTVLVNGEKFTAKRGDILLDAALASGAEIPHDCRSGHCGTCWVRILDGVTIGEKNGTDGMVRACQARVLTDLRVLVEPVPDAVTTKGVVSGLGPVAADIVALRIHLAKPVTYLPGQYYKVRFRGFPARCFSPTLPMSCTNDGDDTVRLHIRRVPGGRVSSALGASIINGHPVKLHGPYGTAYLRPRQSNRLILVSSGTGFAPVWSIAKSALEEAPDRLVVLLLGARNVESLYMGAAVKVLRKYRNVRIIPVVAEASGGVAENIPKGHPTDYVPPLSRHDVVYACGAPPMVEAARSIAGAAGATFYADPFVPQTNETDDGLLSRVLERLCEFRLPMVHCPGPGQT